MKLTDRQRGQLKAAAVFGCDQIDKVTVALQRENPAAFLKESELHQRNFYHQPMSYGVAVPHRSYVERVIPNKKIAYSLEQRHIMAQNHYLTITRQIGVGA